MSHSQNKSNNNNNNNNAGQVEGPIKQAQQQ